MSAGQLVRASADRETSAELTIVTAEGDRVTLSAKTSAHVDYASYTHLGKAGGQGVALRAEASTVDVSRELGLTVDGDLSEQEQADIQKLLGMLANGDVQGALGQAQPNGKLSSLQGFTLSVTQATRVQVAQAERVQVSAAA